MPKIQKSVTYQNLRALAERQYQDFTTTVRRENASSSFLEDVMATQTTLRQRKNARINANNIISDTGICDKSFPELSNRCTATWNGN
ncbi:hypothetical protein AWC38_SpisGene5683 [Stylophora pistillata]|uniref:Uncharacterized protein n=1 Tax=Stylophora pistillata TaxID=50429 RepID=A0A2B4SI51_STYPI|nr:hypothetical protein AWC38_SpisGene5683 [Stylophora pistillata]